MNGRPPPPGEGETPLVSRSTPAGGINTVTAALNSTNQLSTQHNNNNNSSTATISTTLSAAINTSSSTAAALSSIKPRRIENSLNNENQPPSTQNDKEKKRSRQLNNSNNNKQQSNTPTKSSNTTKQSNKSPNPAKPKKTKVNNGKNNTRKKKTARNRTIHELRPTAPATSSNSNNSAPSVLNPSTNTLNAAPAAAAAAAAAAAETTSNAAVTAPSAEPVTLKHALATKTKSKDKKLDISNAKLLEELRPHIFTTENKSVNLAEADRLEFQNKFDTAKALKFEPRKLSKVAKAARDDFHTQLISGGFDQGAIKVTARKGDTSQLRRYFVEDILQCGAGHSFAVGLRKPANLPTNFYSSSPLGRAFSSQKKVATGLGGAIRNFQTGTDYFLLTGRIARNPMQELIQNGTFMLSNLPTLFHAQHGLFSLRFDGTDIEQTFNWFDLINDPLETMFFSSPVVTSRFFNQLFHHRESIQYCYRIYHQLALEVWGDQLYANMLSDAFRSEQMSILKSQATQLTKSLADPCKDVSFVGKEYTAFFVKIDKLFQKNLYDILRQFNDPTASVLSKDEIKQLIEEAKTLFPTLWSLLSSTRGVHPTIKRSAHLIEGKEEQIFMMILQQARMADRRRLTHWAFVQTFSNYARGVCRRAIHNNNYWGINVSTSTMERIMDELSEYLISDQLEFLRNHFSLVWVVDNFQKGEERKFQNGKTSSNFFVGTSMLALPGIPFDDTRYDSLQRPPIFYDRRLCIPSMPNQPAYEEALDFSPGQLHNSLLGHSNMTPVAAPELTGARVEALMRAIDISHWITHSRRVFLTQTKHLPGSFNQQKLSLVTKAVKSKRGKELTKCTYSFQSDSVKFYKQEYGQPTKHNYIGLAAIREDSAKGVGVIGIDVLIRSGVISMPSPGVIKLADDYNKRHVTLVGDRSTVENWEAFIRERENRELSFSEISLMTEALMDASSVLMLLPGDWHTGMSMLQSIFTLHWDGIIEPFFNLLGWKRLTHVVKNNYFTGKRIVELIANEIVRFIKHEFMSKYAEFKEEDDAAQFICDAELAFLEYLNEMTKCDDEWRRVIALFVIDANNFIKFVNSYRRDCPLGIEHGYKTWTPIFHQLGQNKYFKGCLEQVDTLYSGLHSLSRLFESRLTRTTRKYDAKYGKLACALDETIELCHKTFARFATPSDMDGFERQGAFLGTGEQCNRFVDLVYNIAGIKEEVEVLGHAVEPSMMPEMQLVYEVLTLLETHVVKPDRKHSVNLVLSVRDRITTSLDRVERKEKMKKSRNDKYSYNVVEETVEQMSAAANIGATSAHEGEAAMDINDDEQGDAMDVDVDENGGVLVEDGDTDGVKDTDDMDEMEALIALDDGVASRHGGKKRRGKRFPKLHKLTLVDNRMAGDAAIIEKNVKGIRENEKERLKQKRRVSKELYKTVQNREEQSGNTPVGKEMTGLAVPSWRLLAIKKRRDAKFKSKII